jgi:N6-L-threonylcarbamoyladenine synthase
MRILALESSCDDTAAAVVEKGRRVLSSVRLGQDDRHRPYGGVIPELAARDHVLAMNAVVQQALDEAQQTFEDIDCIAATLGPGLIGSLLVGASTAKALALALNKPFRGVHHLHGHLASNYLDSTLEPPFLCLLVSGGHTQLVAVDSYTEIRTLGETLDDAVGESYDKVARLLGLGFPGGPALDRLAQTGDASVFRLPIAKTQNPWDFSFSGLKTASRRFIEEQTILAAEGNASETWKADLAASFQATVVETLIRKTLRCAKALGYSTLTLAGGVSANSAIRTAFLATETQGLQPSIPKLAYCTDNAAMIASAAYYSPWTDALEEDVFSRGSLRNLCMNVDSGTNGVKRT